MNQRISQASKDTKKHRFEGRNVILNRHNPLDSGFEFELAVLLMNSIDLIRPLDCQLFY